MTIEEIDEQIVKNREEFLNLKKLKNEVKQKVDLDFFESIVGKFFFCEVNDSGNESFVSVKKEEDEIIFYELEIDNQSEDSNSVDFSRQKLSQLNVSKLYFQDMYIEIEKELYESSITKLNKFLKEAIKDV